MYFLDEAKRRFYIRALVVVWLFLSVFGSLIHQIPEKIPPDKTYSVIISKWENRFKPIKDELPFKLGVISYLTDADIEGNIGNGDTAGEYTLTQFVMSPIIIEQGENREWILLNMNEKNFQTWYKRKNQEYEFIPYSFNLYLAHKGR